MAYDTDQIGREDDERDEEVEQEHRETESFLTISPMLFYKIL